MNMQSSPKAAKTGNSGFAVMVLLLVAILGLLLRGDFVPGNTLVSNDGPVGRLMSECHRLPERFTGCWEDLNSLGWRDWGASPSISFGLQFLLGPVAFSKLYVPLALLILGCGAWCFFRQSGLATPACILGGLAAALHSAFFSAACWGVASHPITIGMIFFALAALARLSGRQRWLRVALAGLAVGMAVTEGADVGAIFSLYVAAFVIYQAWMADGPGLKNLGAGVARVALLAICAALLAAQAISGLVAADVKGVSGVEQDRLTKKERWEWATQWSLPKKEVLGLAVPGLFGYLDATPDGGNYWGSVGRHPDWDRYVQNGSQGPPPMGFKRFSGGGSYAGVPVVLLAYWAAVQSLRRKDSAFNRSQRQSLWFWLGVSLISLLLAFGRFAPFYRLIYALPYFSAIRNPVKFLHVFSFALVVLFAYGVDGLWRGHMQTAGRNAAQRWAGFRNWWGQAARFDKYWLHGCLLALELSVLAWVVYAYRRDSLEHYLQTVQFDQDQVGAIAGFSIRQVGWFVLFFAGSVALVALVLSGAFAGKRARWGGFLLGFLLVADLARANQPWIRYLDYPMLYASNPIIDKLREKPYMQRVSLSPFRVPPRFSLITQMYQNSWSRNLFPYYNIQALEDGAISRLPDDVDRFQKTFISTNQVEFSRDMLRLWQLTNTRYLVGPAAVMSVLNGRIDPTHHQFRIAERFNIVPKPDAGEVTNVTQLTEEPSDKGSYALVEFTGALPRTKLYSNWQVVTNNQVALDQIASDSFAPEQTVVITGALLPASPVTATNQYAGTVEFSSYAPKHIVLKSEAHLPSVLLLNDRYDPNWNVRVDGKPETLLRCNYLMRGVYLTHGSHTIEFRFQPPIGPLYVSLAAIGVGVVLLGLVLVKGRRSGLQVPAPTVRSQPAPSRPGSQPAPGRAVGNKSAPDQRLRPNPISLRRQGTR
jgi:hypothetical protein